MCIRIDGGGNEPVQPQGPAQPDARVQELMQTVAAIRIGLVYLLNREQGVKPNQTMAQIRDFFERPPMPWEERPNTGIWKRRRTSYIHSVGKVWSRLRLQNLGSRITRAIENDRPMSVRKQCRAEVALLKTFKDLSLEYFGPRILVTLVGISEIVIERALGFSPNAIERFEACPCRLEHALERARKVNFFIRVVAGCEPRDTTI